MSREKSSFQIHTLFDLFLPEVYHPNNETFKKKEKKKTCVNNFLFSLIHLDFFIIQRCKGTANNLDIPIQIVNRNNLEIPI